MELLLVCLGIVIVCGGFIIFNRHAYKDWKNQSYLMKNILFIQLFGFILFSLVSLLILMSGQV